MAQLSVSRRTRRTPFTDRVEAAGVQGYTVYNHMLLPSVFRSLEQDYRHLKTHVQLWDVACERQVEVRGPDALRLLQWVTPRDLSKVRFGRAAYVPLTDASGGLINDPMILKLGDGHYSVSIADSDVLLWLSGLACGAGLDVTLSEPDVSPLGVQGPKARIVMERVFGPEVVDLRFFAFDWFVFQDTRMIISRSGYSGQTGYEIYLPDSNLGPALWDALVAAGEDQSIAAGGPNLIERIEAGLLSYGNDMTRDDSPIQAGLGQYCNASGGYLGAETIEKQKREGVDRMIRGLRLKGEPQAPCRDAWPLYVKGQQIGQITSAAWSPDFNCMIGNGMVARDHWETGSRVEAVTPSGCVDAMVCDTPFTS